MVASSRSDGATFFTISLDAICNYETRHIESTSIVSVGIDSPARSAEAERVGTFKFLGYSTRGSGEGYAGGEKGQTVHTEGTISPGRSTADVP